MIGAIIGDMIGSPFERRPIKTKDIEIVVSEFTDDTVLTVAVANAILTGSCYTESIMDFAQMYPNAGYGKAFRKWMWKWNPEPYNSCGNGSAARVSPVGFAFNTLADVLKEAKLSAEITHSHPEGIKGAQATALAVFMARKGASKENIRDEIAGRFEYDLYRSLDRIRPAYRFDISCQGSVPESIISFLESDSYEDAAKNAISLGGDTDTMACITGGIAQAFYRKIPGEIIQRLKEKLPLELMVVVDRFQAKYECEF